MSENSNERSYKLNVIEEELTLVVYLNAGAPSSIDVNCASPEPALFYGLLTRHIEAVNTCIVRGQLELAVNFYEETEERPDAFFERKVMAKVSEIMRRDYLGGKPSKKYVPKIRTPSEANLLREVRKQLKADAGYFLEESLRQPRKRRFRR